MLMNTKQGMGGEKLEPAVVREATIKPSVYSKISNTVHNRCLLLLIHSQSLYEMRTYGYVKE